VELIAALCNGVKHYSNRVGAIHAYVLCQSHISTVCCVPSK